MNPGALTGRGNNTWLLDGAEPTLIDAGVGVPEHVAAVAAALNGRALRRVIVTHGHPDHASGVPALRQRWPELDVCRWVGADGTDEADAAWTPLIDGQHITAGDSTLTVIHTPGHALDHICLWNAATRELYGGDMVVQGTTIMIPAGKGGGLRAYLASLDRIAALGPVRIYPGHGPVINDPLALIAEYIAHRRLRDEQVAACLRDGVTDPEAILARVYPDLASSLKTAALATIAAHILNLREP
jgi:glyoxylase-like metal-dependent hydrolase (beta-lactamase superfamily II)